MTKYKELFSRKLIAWYLYDWAYSAFSAVIITFIFAAYFTEKVASNSIKGTEQWGTAMSIAALIIAVTSPIFGAIADHEGRRKPWLFFFALLTIVGCSLLWFAKPHADYVTLALLGVVIADIGFEVGMVFYNSMLNELVPQEYIGRVSGWGWGCGYLGGLSALTLCLSFFINNHFSFLHLNQKAFEQIRIVGPFIALWLLVFCTPLFIFTPDRKRFGLSFRQSIRAGLVQLKHTLSILRQHKMIARFLVARMIYIDGLNTVFAFGGIYAAGTFHFELKEVILLGITMNIAAGLGAISFAWLDDHLGSRFTILLALIVIIFSTALIVLVKTVILFWSLGLLLSLCVGPVQSSSRALLIRLTPKEVITEMFGLYALSGKATAFLGPWLLGWFTYTFTSQRIGVSTVLIFFIIGALLLRGVKA